MTGSSRRGPLRRESRHGRSPDQPLQRRSKGPLAPTHPAAAARRVRARGLEVAHAQLFHLNPFPVNLGELVTSYEAVLIPETNLGQLVRLIRAEFLVDARSLTKVQGTPFKVGEVERAIVDALDRLGDLPEGLAEPAPVIDPEELL